MCGSESDATNTLYSFPSRKRPIETVSENNKSNNKTVEKTAVVPKSREVAPRAKRTSADQQVSAQKNDQQRDDSGQESDDDDDEEESEEETVVKSVRRGLKKARVDETKTVSTESSAKTKTTVMPTTAANKVVSRKQAESLKVSS
eukprot:gene34127-42079_t